MKYGNGRDRAVRIESPSVWREWIEIVPAASRSCKTAVSLRVEGVD